METEAVPITAPVRSDGMTDAEAGDAMAREFIGWHVERGHRTAGQLTAALAVRSVRGRGLAAFGDQTANFVAGLSFELRVREIEIQILRRELTAERDKSRRLCRKRLGR